LWIVLDHTFAGECKRTTTTWTTSHNISLSEGHIPGSYILQAKDSNAKIVTFILSSKGAQINRFKGSFSPFAGWESHKPAPAIVIRQNAKNSWAAVIWFLSKKSDSTLEFKEPPSMVDFKGLENWQIMLPRDFSSIRISRKENVITAYKNEKEAAQYKKVRLSRPPLVEDKVATIRQGYESAAIKYPRKTYSMHRHKKATYFVLFLFVLQEVFFMIYRRSGNEYYAALRGLNLIGWIVVGIWIVRVLYT
jgi:hypothetical protein